MAESIPPHTKKRIIVCCDGTWMDSDSDVQVPSNVTRISRALKREGIDKETGKVIPQIIYYNPGVGTENNFYSKYIGGGTGAGLSEHIREAYSFICVNYNAGDEIFIIGFSRGAFTARSISSLINCIGLLTPEKGLAFFIQVFEDWEFGMKPNWKTTFPNDPWPNRPRIDKPAYLDKLCELELTRPNINIKCVAVWDTVGALGIPLIGLLPQPASTDFSFVDTKVAPNIEYAFHALGLDERRRSYSPTIWEKPAGQKWPVVLKQTWFPGVHSDIGGSYANADLANITLAWMVSQLDPLLAFDHSYIVTQNRLSMERHKKKHQPVPAWGLGKIHNSMTAFFKLGGQKIRTPKEYTATTADDLKPFIVEVLQYWFHIHSKNNRPLLEGTNEHVHSSVRIRMGLNGRGYSDAKDSTYATEALQGWTMNGMEVTPSQLNLSGTAGKMSHVVWKKTISRPNSERKGVIEEIQLEMPEDEIGGLERTIMEAWPEIDRDFESIRPGSHASNVKRSSTYPDEHPASGPAAAGSARGMGSNGEGHRQPVRVGTI